MRGKDAGTSSVTTPMCCTSNVDTTGRGGAVDAGRATQQQKKTTRISLGMV